VKEATWGSGFMTGPAHYALRSLDRSFSTIYWNDTEGKLGYGHATGLFTMTGVRTRIVRDDAEYPACLSPKGFLGDL
jgi:hypothetical protein